MASAVEVDDRHWSEKRCLELIKEYRARPILWDKNCPFYYNKQMRPDAWDEIGKAMKSDPNVCKQKMSILMSSYRREKAKIAASIRNKDKRGVYQSYWFAFKDMSVFSENNTENVYTTDGDVYMSSLIKVTPVRQNKRRRTSSENSTQGDPLQFTPTVSATQVTAAPDSEEIKSFATFVATKMKKYSECAKNAVQKEICDIIFKADQGFYDKPNDGNHNSGSIRVRRFHVDDSVVGFDDESMFKNYYSDAE